jgi:hypothetical protein
MGKFVEESFKNGTLKDTAGLKRTEHGYRIKSKGRQADPDRWAVHRVQGSRRRLRHRRDQGRAKKADALARQFMELHRHPRARLRVRVRSAPLEDF